MGSWMWKKLLKYRTIAQNLHKVEVKNGASTSFWYDSWSSMGRLIDLTGTRGVIDLGIPLDATLEKVINSHRRRHHRSENLNAIEASLAALPTSSLDDVHQWKYTISTYKNRFYTKNTWNLTRAASTIVTWYKGIWFPKATPKFAFLSWLVMHKRLSTSDRMKNWNSNIDSECILCKRDEEDHNHLFFKCTYSSSVWRKLSKGLLQNDYTSNWEELQLKINNSTMPKVRRFLLRYLIQATTYYIWRERNSRRHGDTSATTEVLYKTIDKQVRNFISSLREGDQDMGNYTNALQIWFASQEN